VEVSLCLEPRREKCYIINNSKKKEKSSLEDINKNENKDDLKLLLSATERKQNQKLPDIVVSFDVYRQHFRHSGAADVDHLIQMSESTAAAAVATPAVSSTAPPPPSPAAPANPQSAPSAPPPPPPPSQTTPTPAPTPAPTPQQQPNQKPQQEGVNPLRDVMKPLNDLYHRSQLENGAMPTHNNSALNVPQPGMMPQMGNMADLQQKMNDDFRSNITHNHNPPPPANGKRLNNPISDVEDGGRGRGARRPVPPGATGGSGSGPRQDSGFESKPSAPTPTPTPLNVHSNTRDVVTALLIDGARDPALAQVASDRMIYLENQLKAEREQRETQVKTEREKAVQLQQEFERKENERRRSQYAQQLNVLNERLGKLGPEFNTRNQGDIEMLRKMYSASHDITATPEVMVRCSNFYSTLAVEEQRAERQRAAVPMADEARVRSLPPEWQAKLESLGQSERISAPYPPATMHYSTTHVPMGVDQMVKASSSTSTSAYPGLYEMGQENGDRRPPLDPRFVPPVGGEDSPYVANPRYGCRPRVKDQLITASAMSSNDIARYGDEWVDAFTHQLGVTLAGKTMYHSAKKNQAFSWNKEDARSTGSNNRIYGMPIRATS
jgi:hypothetical protein